MAKTKAKLALFALALASLGWGFWLMFSAHALWAFSAPEEDLSYGYFVPLFSLYILWRERARLVPGRGCWAAVLLLLPSLFLGFIGIRGAQLRFEIVGFIGIVWSLTLLFWGWRTAKAAMFPCAFLLFCIPLNSFLDVITVHLRLFATGTAFAILKGMGADIVRQGTMLASSAGTFAIDVAAPCSGLRSIFALMALTAAYSYFAQPTWGRRALLFASSVPLAVLGNVVRILTIVATANWCSTEFATGFYHDYSGYVVFLVAVSLMVAFSGLLTRLGTGPETEDAPREATVPEETSPWRSGALGLVALGVVAFMVFQARETSPELAEAPALALTELDGYAMETLPPGEAELETLPKDTLILKRRYVHRATGDWYLVSAIVGGTSKGSIHRPELCLPSQGFSMVRPRNRRTAGRDWHLIDIERGYGLPLGFAYTFFNQEGFSTASHTGRILRDVIDRSLKNRYDRWVMITVNSSRADEEAMLGFLSRLEEVIWAK